MASAIYPATFDPITYGHVDVAERASRLFETLTVAVFDLPRKNVLFSLEERLEMVRQSLQHLDNVLVSSYSGLTTAFANEANAKYIVRGLRALSDFEWELQLSMANHSLDSDVETICFMASQDHSFLSSSILKEIALNHGNVEHLAPPIVVKALLRKRKSTNQRPKESVQVG